MNEFTQLDLINPEHVMIITKRNRVIVSVKKGAITWEVSFAVAGDPPMPPLQQPLPGDMAVS